MAKTIRPQYLAEIVSKLLTDPTTVGELDDAQTYADFMTEIAAVVCDYCGGEVQLPASVIEDQNVWGVGIIGNDSLPDDGGIWKSYDPSGSL